MRESKVIIEEVRITTTGANFGHVGYVKVDTPNACECYEIWFNSGRIKIFLNDTPKDSKPDYELDCPFWEDAKLMLAKFCVNLALEALSKNNRK